MHKTLAIIGAAALLGALAFAASLLVAQPSRLEATRSQDTQPPDAALRGWTEADKNLLRAKLDPAALAEALPIKLSPARHQEIADCVLDNVWTTFPDGASSKPPITAENLSATIRVGASKCGRATVDKVLGAATWTAEFDAAFKSICSPLDSPPQHRSCDCILRVSKKSFASPAVLYAIWTNAPTASARDRATLERLKGSCASE